MKAEPNPVPEADDHRRRDKGGLGGLRTVLVLTLWPIAIVLTAYVYITFGLLGRFGEHWPLLIPLVVIGLIISGQLGMGYGLPSLYRDSPDRPWWDIGRSLLSGLGVGLLVLTVTISIYYGEFTGHFERVQSNWHAWEGQWDRLGEGGRSPTLWDLVREPALLRSDNGPSALIVGCAPDAAGGRRLWAGLPLHSLAAYVFQFWASLPIAVMFALCVLLPTPEVERRIRFGRTGGLRWLSEKVGYLLGVLLAIAVGYAFGLSVPLLAGLNADLGGIDRWPILRFSQLLGSNPRPEQLDVASHAVRSIGGYVLFFVVVFGAALRIPRLSPGLGICLVFNLYCLAYLLVSTFAPSWQFVLVGVLVLWLIVVNSGRYKYRFPGLGRYYDPPGEGESTAERGPKDLEDEEARVDRGDVPDVLPTILLSDRQTLKAWWSRLERGEDRLPRLVLVATTGGAYRASFWTTTVLESLSQDRPRLLNHVRLITGASGGMVGAAYVVACLEKPRDEQADAHDPGHGDRSRPAGGPTRRLSEETGRDSLAPVARQLIRSDLWNAFVPVRHHRDRGVALDEQWKTLQVPFSALREGEREGWRPSLVLSPMVVETGRRLLFSNLDLFGLTESRGLRRREVSFLADEDPERLRRDHKALQDGGAIGRGRLYSRSAVEFFRAFPASYGVHHDGSTPDQAGPPSGPPLTVATAVRMNASFPYISPATSLPVEPVRRVVDAGYYDNYGVDLAANWALQNRDWIREKTSGIALIQIRASENEIERKRLWTGPPRDESTSLVARLLRRLTRGIYALSTPPKGAFSALGGSMAYRNDLLVAELDEVFNSTDDGQPECDVPADSGATRRFFETFIFENPIPFGMNWFVTADEILRMERSMEGPLEGPKPDREFRRNQGQKAAFLAWFGDGVGPGRTRQRREVPTTVEAVGRNEQGSPHETDDKAR